MHWQIFYSVTDCKRRHWRGFAIYKVKLHQKMFWCTKCILLISGLYYKHVTIVNYASSSINKLKASLNDDARVIIYNRHTFIVQATGEKWRQYTIFAIYNISVSELLFSSLFQNCLESLIFVLHDDGLVYCCFLFLNYSYLINFILKKLPSTHKSLVNAYSPYYLLSPSFA